MMVTVMFGRVLLGRMLDRFVVLLDLLVLKVLLVLKALKVIREHKVLLV
jgi:hypothetical protein